MIRHCLILAFLSLACGVGLAQDDSPCSEVQRELEAVIKEFPEMAAENVAIHVRRRPECAGALIESAIAASQASDELVASMVRAAVGSAPGKAVAIAESAIATAPSASDEVAQVVQELLGDCDAIAEDVSISIGQNQGRLLMVLEDALRAHGNCVCEIVMAAVRAADGSGDVVSQIVELAVTVKPGKAAEISECASAAAPQLSSAVQKGLDLALSDQSREAGALPASRDVELESVEERYTEAVEASSPPDSVYSEDELTEDVETESWTSEETVAGHGKNPKGSGKDGHGKKVVEDEDEEDGWDWIHWGAASGHHGAVYLIAPAGGVLAPGSFLPHDPLSPSDPKHDPKKEPEAKAPTEDDKKGSEDDKKDPSKID